MNHKNCAGEFQHEDRHCWRWLSGKTLTRRLSAAAHDVKVANSRGPETIGAEVLGRGDVPSRGRRP